MERKHPGEYLAPEIKVREILGRAVLCVSPDLSGLVVDDNPFDDNTEEEW